MNHPMARIILYFAVALLGAAAVSGQVLKQTSDGRLYLLKQPGPWTIGECLVVTGTNAIDTDTCAGGGGGTISGPVSSTDNAVTRWDGTAADTIQDSGVVIDDSGNMSFPAAARVTASTFEWVEDDTSRGCAVGDFFVYADDSENKMKKCENGALSELGAVSGFISAIVDDNDLVIADPANLLRCDSTMSCYEFDPAEVSVGVDTSGIPAPSQASMNANGALTRSINQTVVAQINISTGSGGSLKVNGRPHLGNHPPLRYWVDKYALNSGKKYVVWPDGNLVSTVTSGAQERMAFPCANLRTIALTFRNKDTGAPIVWPASNTLTVGLNVEGVDTAAHCTMISGGLESDYECDLIDAPDVFDRGELVAVWLSNSGASTLQINAIIQIHCS